MTDYVGFDLETTGVSSFRDVPVSYGFVQNARDGLAVSVLVEGGYVNPGVAIPAGASAIHGITDEMVAKATVLVDAVEHIAAKILSVWGSGGVIVGMNVGYDLTMVDSLCRRLGIATLEERGPIGAVMDILVLDRHFDKWRKGSRKLTDLCLNYGVTLESAHSAAADAAASLLVFEAMVAKYPAIESILISEINATLRAWYQEWLSSFSSYLERKGEAPVDTGRYEWPIHLDA
ncbi:MAG TPA: exonuclease domain-containing protein [Acidimicrobiales bacterium]|nr:exonuclease domain-containing protein [Acidimicrobiales bacterium]